MRTNVDIDSFKRNKFLINEFTECELWNLGFPASLNGMAWFSVKLAEVSAHAAAL